MITKICFIAGERLDRKAKINVVEYNYWSAATLIQPLSFFKVANVTALSMLDVTTSSHFGNGNPSTLVTVPGYHRS